MLNIIILAIIFSIAGSATTVLLGDRNLLDGNLLSWNKFFQILFHWRFIVAMFSALLARYLFMVLNQELLKIPALAPNSTTIASFITSVGVIFMIVGNAYFLGERISSQQGLGAVVIMFGIWIVLK